jgi:DNA-binding transcriptional MerR regulator
MEHKTGTLDSDWVELILAAKDSGLTYEEIKDYLQNHSKKRSFIHSQNKGD